MRVRVTISLDDLLLRQIDAFSDKCGLKRSTIIEQAARKHMKEIQRKEDEQNQIGMFQGKKLRPYPKYDE